MNLLKTLTMCEVAMIAKPWMWLFGLCICLGVVFAIIKWHRYSSRQERLCPTSAVCRLNDISKLEKIPSVPTESVRPLFVQPLFFLGEGKQSVAYETADGRFVLKLFKKAVRKSHKKPLDDAVLGAIIAKTVIPEETGVIACSFGPQHTKLPVVRLLTDKGKVEKINLQDVPFVFQRKAQPFKQTLMRLVAEKKLKEAAARIDSVFTLLAACREKGVIDRDGSLVRNGNIGFVENRAILVDTGKLCRINDRRRLTLHDLNRLKPMLSWLETACPELVPTYKVAQERYKASM
jgi:hypothetical protein